MIREPVHLEWLVFKLDNLSGRQGIARRRTSTGIHHRTVKSLHIPTVGFTHATEGALAIF